MKMSIKKDSIIICAFILMCISVFFLRWYNNSNLIAYVGILSSAALLILFPNKNKIEFQNILTIFIFIIYILINLLFTYKHDYIFDELFIRTFMPFCILFFFTKFFNDKKVLAKVKNPIFIIFNLYYLINTFIIFKQINTKGFMVRNFSTNTYYPDQIDGLFGTNGTHRLCIFYLICLYLNLLFFNDKNIVKSKISKVMFIFIMITSLYVSAFNDNRMYYLLLIIFLIPIFYKKIKLTKKIKFKKIMKVLLTATISISTIFILYNNNEKIRSFININIYENNIKKTIDKANNSRIESTQKKEERLELTKYAINNGNGYGIGKGIGSIILYGDPNLPKHFGLCETTNRIYTGGIIYLLMIIYIYSKYIYTLINSKKLSIYIYILLTLLTFSLYARIFTLFDETFLISLLYLFIAKYYETNNEIKQ